MTESFLNGRVTLHCGDNRAVLNVVADCSIDSICTDPPYALVSIVKRFGKPGSAPAKGNEAYQRASAGFMGKQWDTGEVAFDPTFWGECLRVLKPGGHVVAFSGTRTYHRMACAIEDAGFEIRDQLQWVYGSGFPKSHDVSKGIDKAAGVEFDARPASGVGFMGPEGPGGYNVTKNQLSRKGESTDSAIQWQGWGTALKPACEPICFARKPLIGTVAANVLEHGTGAINIDGCRIGNESTIRHINGANKQDATQWRTGQQGAFVGGSDSGRWPANIIHDGSDEVIAAFPDAESSFRTSRDHQGGDFAWKAGNTPGFADSGSAARFFYQVKQDEICPLKKHARDAETFFSLRSERVVFALNHAVEAITRRLVLHDASYRVQDISVSGPLLEQIETLLTATILGIEKRFSRGSPPEKHSLSGNHASVAAEEKQIGTITITISLLKSNGFAEVATFDCIAMNAAVGESVSAQRLFYSSKADADDRLGSKHPTVKPVDLMQWLVRLVTPKGGIVLDPFAGTGTTAEACFREGMRCILIERETEYQADIRRRMALVLAGPDERKRESIKAKVGDLPFEAGSLFA